jgi:hypothetical protein
MFRELSLHSLSVHEAFLAARASFTLVTMAAAPPSPAMTALVKYFSRLVCVIAPGRVASYGRHAVFSVIGNLETLRNTLETICAGSE